MGLTDAVPPGEFVLEDVRGLVLLAYCHDVDLGQLSHRMVLASERPGTAPSLGIHISDIVQHRADKEMGGLDTGSLVAMMAYEQTVRDRAACVLPGKAVRIQDRAMVTATGDCSVSRLEFGPLPYPAAITVADFRQESLVKRFPGPIQIFAFDHVSDRHTRYYTIGHT